MYHPDLKKLLWGGHLQRLLAGLGLHEKHIEPAPRVGPTVPSWFQRIGAILTVLGLVGAARVIDRVIATSGLIAGSGQIVTDGLTSSNKATSSSGLISSSGPTASNGLIARNGLAASSSLIGRSRPGQTQQAEVSVLDAAAWNEWARGLNLRLRPFALTRSSSQTGNGTQDPGTPTSAFDLPNGTGPEDDTGAGDPIEPAIADDGSEPGTTGNPSVSAGIAAPPHGLQMNGESQGSGDAAAIGEARGRMNGERYGASQAGSSAGADRPAVVLQFAPPKVTASADRGRRFQKILVTAYSSLPAETDSTPGLTASNTRVSAGTIAFSRDLLRTFTPKAPFDFGDKVLIPGVGVFEVRDTMSPRWKEKADIWVESPQQARSWGRRDVFVTRVDEDAPTTVFKVR